MTVQVWIERESTSIHETFLFLGHPWWRISAFKSSKLTSQIQTKKKKEEETLSIPFGLFQARTRHPRHAAAAAAEAEDGEMERRGCSSTASGYCTFTLLCPPQ